MLQTPSVSERQTILERVCRGERGPRVPVWIMRQAGRYLPDYRELRKSADFLTATRTPELAAQITMLPMRRFRLDAAILFSDIMTPLESMGVPVRFTPGPIVDVPIRSHRQVKALRELHAEERVPFVLETIRLVRSELETHRALIGFAGAPFTLFCYLVEGRGSKDFMQARSFLLREPVAAGDLLTLLGQSMSSYLVAQARAGADAVMLFDSWIGLLGPAEYRRFILPVLQRVVSTFRSQARQPIIYFARGGAALLEAITNLDVDVVGVDWNLPLSDAVRQLGPRTVVQGNLDPAYLFAPRGDLGAAIDRVLESGAGAAGHIFNLGHGIHQDTDPDQVAFLVDRVHETSERLGL